MYTKDMTQILDDFESVSRFVGAVNELPYFPDSKLEQAVAGILVDSGFQDGTELFHSQFQPPNVKNITAGRANRVSFNKSIRSGAFDVSTTIPDFQKGLWFIDQPMGTSSYPDKMLFLYGRIVVIEEKSSKKSGFRFNNTPPHPRTFYIFSDGRHDQTRIMEASRFITIDQYNALITAQERSQKAHAVIAEDTMKQEGMNDFFIIPSSRPQFLTRGGYAKTDFVTLSNKNQWHHEPARDMLYQLKKGVTKHLSNK